jgi:RNA polymerase sigma factor (sigma-70 family)
MAAAPSSFTQPARTAPEFVDPVVGNPEADKQPSRADLVAAAVERNRDIWVRMALRITADVYDAEDAVQEAISKVLTGPGTLTDADSAGRYLTRSVSHCAIDKVRARSRLTSFAEEDEPGPRLAPVDADQESRLLSAEAALAQRQQLERMLAELQTLPQQQREAIELLVLRQPPLKLREASEVTGAPISTLHSRLQSALESLRKILSESSA